MWEPSAIGPSPGPGPHSPAFRLTLRSDSSILRVWSAWLRLRAEVAAPAFFDGPPMQAVPVAEILEDEIVPSVAQKVFENLALAEGPAIIKQQAVGRKSCC